MHVSATGLGMSYEEFFTLHGFVKSVDPNVDLIHQGRKVAVEVKASNTADSGCAKASKLKKLAEFKRQHADFQVVYGCVNEKKRQDPAGVDRIKVVDGVNVRYMTGELFMTFAVQSNEWKAQFRQIANAIRTFTQNFIEN